MSVDLKAHDAREHCFCHTQTQGGARQCATVDLPISFVERKKRVANGCSDLQSMYT